MKTTVTLWAFTPKGETGLTWLVAQAICLYTRSKWFHVGVSLGHDFVEARPFCGVVHHYEIPRDAVKIRSWVVDEMPEVENWIGHQLGKPYDWAGIFGFVFGPSKGGRADRGKWFCSELASVILRKFGIDVCMKALPDAHALGGWKWKPIPQWEITPGMLVKAVDRV